MALKNYPPLRPALTREQLEEMVRSRDPAVIADFMRLKLAAHEKALLAEINLIRDAERQARCERMRVEAQPIAADFRKAGFRNMSILDFSYDYPPKYSKLIPILLKHLVLPYSDAVRDRIACLLAVPEPEVREAWSVLVEEYRKAPIGRGVVIAGEIREYKLSAKDGLAEVLAAAVTEDTLEELIALAKDPTLGDSRRLLLPPLRKRSGHNLKVRVALEHLATDEELKNEIGLWWAQ